MDEGLRIKAEGFAIMNNGFPQKNLETTTVMESKERPKAGQHTSPARSEAQGWVMGTKNAQGLKARNKVESRAFSQLYCIGLSALPDLMATPPSPALRSGLGWYEIGPLARFWFPRNSTMNLGL
jgi:hypothetical protein